MPYLLSLYICSWGENSGLSHCACHLTYSWEGAVVARLWLMNLYTPLLCVSNSTACAANPPLFPPSALKK